MQLAGNLKLFGIDYFCTGKKFLVYNLVNRNLKTKYRRSIFGLLWTLLNPLAMAIIYYFVFKVVMKVQVPHYPVFILAGVLPWNFFGQTVGESMESLVGNIGLISKVPIPIQIFPYVGTITNLVTLLLALPIVLGMALITGVHLGLSLLMLPYFLLALFFITYGFSMVLAIAFVFFRDLRHLIGILIQLWFYATPVVYSETMVPAKFKFIVYANPLGTIFSGIHHILMDGVWPTGSEVAASAIWAGLFTLLSVFFHKRFSNDLVEHL